eukprot:923478_1
MNYLLFDNASWTFITPDWYLLFFLCDSLSFLLSPLRSFGCRSNALYLRSNSSFNCFTRCILSYCCLSTVAEIIPCDYLFRIQTVLIFLCLHFCLFCCFAAVIESIFASISPPFILFFAHFLVRNEIGSRICTISRFQP